MAGLPVNIMARTQAETIATEALLVTDTAVVTLEGPILMCTPGPRSTRLPTPQKFEMCAWQIVAASEQVSDAWKIRRWSAKAYRKYARSSCFKRASKTTIGRNCGRRGHATHKAARPTVQHKSTLQNNRYGLHLFITLLDWIWYRSFKLKAKIVINYKQIFIFSENNSIY